MVEHHLFQDLKTILFQGEVDTQEDIRQALEAKGHRVNQSKISRLLRKIGAVKSKNEWGQVVYRLPREPAPPTVDSQIANLVAGVQHNEAVIMVMTSPGSAQLIARILDYHAERLHILGTIAGDDTIWVMPKSIHAINESVKAIEASLL